MSSHTFNNVHSQGAYMAGHSQSDGKVDEVTFDSVHCCEMGVHLSRHRRDSRKGVCGAGFGVG